MLEHDGADLGRSGHDDREPDECPGRCEARFSAVIINYNGGERLLACASAIVAHGDGVEDLILVDNGSSDGSRERFMSAFPDARLIHIEGNPGPATARNRGIEAAYFDHVLLADSDTRLTPCALAKLDNARQQLDATVVCPRIVLTSALRQVQCEGAAPHFIGTMTLLKAHTPSAAPEPAHEVNGLISAVMLVDRRRVLEAGGFNETFFFYFEDLEFGLRLRLLGHVIACAPAAIVAHDQGVGTKGLSYRGAGRYPPLRAYYTMRNRLLTIALCFHWRTIIALLPALIAYEAATVGLALSRGWLPQWLRAWGWMIANARQVSRQRQQIQLRRRLPDRAVLAGGRLPLASGLLPEGLLKLTVAAFSRVLDSYWRLVRAFAG